MTTITNPQIKTIIDFIARQMDGDQVPTSNSAELRDLTAAVNVIQSHGSTAELRELGLHAVRAVIDRVRSNLAAEKALREFIQPGGDHA
jgi:hypothetical protein